MAKLSRLDRLLLLERFYVRPDRLVESGDGRREFRRLTRELGRERFSPTYKAKGRR